MSGLNGKGFAVGCARLAAHPQRLAKPDGARRQIRIRSPGAGVPALEDELSTPNDLLVFHVRGVQVVLVGNVVDQPILGDFQCAVGQVLAGPEHLQVFDQLVQ